VQEIAKECRRGFRSNGDKESANTKRRREHCTYSDRKSTNVKFHDHLLEQMLIPIFIVQLMLMIFAFLPLAAPMLTRTAAAATGHHHPDKQSDKNNPNPVAL